MKVPFMDLKARHAPLRAELAAAMEAVMDSGEFSGGSFVERFEEDFAAYCGTRHAIGVGSGTDALWLTLLAMGIRPGDEVVTVAMTFVATVEAILLAGARPVFVDIDPVSYTLDPGAIEAAITPRTRAIIPVHLFGHPADMDGILEVARKHGLKVIEDAAQAHGAVCHGRRAGSLADAGCFSFYPAKNLGAMGEGGAVTTDDDALADSLRALRNHGQTRKNHHLSFGWNSRLDGVQAAMLSVKLRHLDEGNRQRSRHAGRYRQALSGLADLVLPDVSPGISHAWHIHAVRTSRRAGLWCALRNRDIGFGVHYPVPVHLQRGYRKLGWPQGSLPVSERCASEFVSLPIGPELTGPQIDKVIGALAAWAEAPAAAV